MLLVIDSNEYIFAFGSFKEISAGLLLDTLLNNPVNHSVRIPRTIFEEVKRNVSLEAFKEFNNFIIKLTNDAFIAAYAEWVSADVLVTENRHFLSRQSNLPFKVLTATDCLKILSGA